MCECVEEVVGGIESIPVTLLIRFQGVVLLFFFLD